MWTYEAREGLGPQPTHCHLPLRFISQSKSHQGHTGSVGSMFLQWRQWWAREGIFAQQWSTPQRFIYGSAVKNPPVTQETWGSISWRRKWQSTPVFLPRKSHRQKSLVGTVHGKELDTTDHTPKHGLLYNTCVHTNSFFIPWMLSVSSRLNINVFLTQSYKLDDTILLQIRKLSITTQPAWGLTAVAYLALGKKSGLRGSASCV